MKMVSFPEGLKITKEEIKKQFKDDLEAKKDSVYDRRIAVIEKLTGRFIGECKLGTPDKDFISETDVKLLPEFWGKAYGKEIKKELCHYLFTKTNCQIVTATPNKLNIGSQKMQEYCGGVKVSEGLFEAKDEENRKRCNVSYYIYHITRENYYQKFPEFKSS